MARCNACSRIESIKSFRILFYGASGYPSQLLEGSL